MYTPERFVLSIIYLQSSKIKGIEMFSNSVQQATIVQKLSCKQVVSYCVNSKFVVIDPVPQSSKQKQGIHGSETLP